MARIMSAQPSTVGYSQVMHHVGELTVTSCRMASTPAGAEFETAVMKRHSFGVVTRHFTNSYPEMLETHARMLRLAEVRDDEAIEVTPELTAYFA